MIPAFRPYLVSVVRKHRLSDHFMRVIFTGEHLDAFGTDGYDQRIKILLPSSPGSWGDPLLFSDEATDQLSWYERWRALTPSLRYLLRTYTVRAVNQARREVTVDFVLHDHAGPAGRFAATCRVGDEIGIVGPNALSKDSAVGIDFHHRGARNLLIMGDETAVPAVGSILETLQRDGWNGHAAVLLEVPDESDELTLPQLPGVHISWQARHSAAVLPQEEAPRQGATLLQRLHDLPQFAAQASSPLGTIAPAGTTLEDVDVDRDLLWEVPDQSEREDGGSLYAWVAGEAAAVREIRRTLVAERHMDRTQVAFMGYWRQGRAEAD